MIKKQNKERKSFTLLPVNVAWLEQKSLQLSTPDDKVSDSELMDRLITAARLNDQPLTSTGSTTPSRKEKKTKDANTHKLIHFTDELAQVQIGTP